jgi:hypothetical protein
MGHIGAWAGTLPQIDTPKNLRHSRSCQITVFAKYIDEYGKMAM